MKILKVILSKLRANNQSGYPDYKLRQVVSIFSDDDDDVSFNHLSNLSKQDGGVWMSQKSTNGFLVCEQTKMEL